MSESQMPKVTVVIPTHNRAHLVMRAVRSVQEQTITDFELIVVDDCGTDNTREVIEACEDPRVSYIKTDTNRGPAGARNAGIAIARGEYIAFLDSDDEWLPRKLELQLQVFETTSFPNLGAVHGSILCVPEVGYVYANSILVGENQWICPAPIFRGDAFDDVLAELGMPGTGSIVMVHRRVTDGGILFDETLPAYEDYEFLLQTSRHYQVETMEEPLDRKYEDHGGPRVWDSPSVIAGGLRLLEKYESELRSRPRIRQRRELAVAAAYTMEGDNAAARSHVIKAVRARPFDIGTWIALAAVMLNSRLFLRIHPIGLAEKRVKKIGSKLASPLRVLVPSRTS